MQTLYYTQSVELYIVHYTVHYYINFILYTILHTPDVDATQALDVAVSGSART